MHYTLLMGLLLGWLFNAYGQEISIGQWRDHLPYNNVKSIAYAKDKVYCATGYGLFEYSLNDQSITRYTKVSGLSDFEVNAIAWDDAHQLLVVAYSNANVDIIENNQIYNISDIKRKPILGSKIINKILIQGNLAYLSCGFGIVVLDVTRKEVKDTYIIGENGSQLGVNDLTCNGPYFFAATEKGIYKASATNPNLANYANWTRESAGLKEPVASYDHIAALNSLIFVNRNGTGFNRDTLLYYNGTKWGYVDSLSSWELHNLEVHNGYLFRTNYFSVEQFDNTLTRTELMQGWGGSVDPWQAIPGEAGVMWIADGRYGLIRYLNNSISEQIAPKGPWTSNVAGLAIDNGKLWVASGGVNASWGNMWRTDGIFMFDNQTWTNINRDNTSGMDTLFDPIRITVDPSNADRIYVASWSRGLAEITNGQITNMYNDLNSDLQRIDVPGYFWIGVGGLAWDDEQNLWMTNSSVAKPLVVKRADGKWSAFSLGSKVTTANNVADVISSSSGAQWVLVVRGPTKGIAVFDANHTLDNTSDDRRKFLESGIGKGNLPSDEVLSIAEDREGEIWVGTAEGPCVFYTPESVFDGGDAAEAQRILVERDGYTEYLLDGNAITSIAVDGANRKWLGTDMSGVFLLSPDGTKELLHFTAENSPLFSNKIVSIAINHDNGEVFFATDRGVISYKATATKGENEFKEILVYPNPVRENYDGPIAIRGLVEDANVKITTISGSIVFETTALGGQAIWDGKNFDGQRASSGVYLVFCTNDDGSETLVTKIVLIHGS
ncbi:MAG: hypothetical protein H6585_15100 [Flavobacteriales bacterium]|nr:hypothetical protein [Flavobacteriales bacterium]